MCHGIQIALLLLYGHICHFYNVVFVCNLISIKGMHRLVLWRIFCLSFMFVLLILFCLVGFVVFFCCCCFFFFCFFFWSFFSCFIRSVIPIILDCNFFFNWGGGGAHESSQSRKVCIFVNTQFNSLLINETIYCV